MFPISDSIKSGKFPIFAIIIIAINLIVFYYQITLPASDAFTSTYALTPSLINILAPETLITFISSMFLHGGFLHIAANMWFLWIFADNVEASLGKVKFVLIYLSSGIAGSLTQYFLNPESTIPMIGASGAVSGILGAYIVLFPHAKIKTIVIWFFVITIASIPAFFYIFYWFVIQLISGIASLPFSFQTGGIAFWAHVGGFAAGVFLARRLKSKASKQENVIEGEIVE